MSRRGPRRGSGAGLDAGASGDYRAWPFKDGKPQRPEAGQGSGSRACPPARPPRPWEAFHSAPIRGTQPGQCKTARTTTRFGLAGVWGRRAHRWGARHSPMPQARACLPCTRSACYRRPQTGRTAHPHGGAVTEQRTTKTLASPCVGALPSRWGARTSPGSPASLRGSVQRRRLTSRCTDRSAGGCADRRPDATTRARALVGLDAAEAMPWRCASWRSRGRSGTEPRK